VIIAVVCLLVRCLLGCRTVLTRSQLSTDAGLLALRHENAVLRRQIDRVRYQPGDRLRLAALSESGRAARRRCRRRPGCWCPAGGSG
jgi:putative transposase